jgi:hypothetical protein
MLALGNQSTGIQESNFFAEKLTRISPYFQHFILSLMVHYPMLSDSNIDQSNSHQDPSFLSYDVGQVIESP